MDHLLSGRKKKGDDFVRRRKKITSRRREGCATGGRIHRCRKKPIDNGKRPAGWPRKKEECMTTLDFEEEKRKTEN